LIESELFGHEKGAFTGAGVLRRGRFELGDDGTVFLDEIGDLEMGLQTKLLRVLQDRRYERVGGSRTLMMRARVIAATSHDLLQAVREGRFRQDLYFRLNVLKFRVPALRERSTDLPLLVQGGLRRLSTALGVPTPRVSEAFCEYLTDYDWPGNVRELMNLLERLLVQRRGALLDVEDLEGILEPVAPSESDTAIPPDENDEVALIRAALADTGGNIARASRRLGVPRGTLRYRIEKYGLGALVPKD
jgi:DNA-binding NtrC family response regulator